MTTFTACSLLPFLNGLGFTSGSIWLNFNMLFRIFFSAEQSYNTQEIKRIFQLQYFKIHMKVKLITLFLCLLVLSLAQNECSESRLQKIQTGEIVLNPNDLGSAGSNKNYDLFLDSAGFVKDDYLTYAFAIAGFETACNQKFYSLVVDTVTIEAQNTRMKIVVNFLDRSGATVTTWTKVKLTYLVVSSLRVVTTGAAAQIWAVTQNVVLTGDITSTTVLTDQIFLGTTSGDECGLSYTAANGFNYGIKCQTAIPQVEFDIAVHTYIMGFQYEPSSAVRTEYIAATIVSPNMALNFKEAAITQPLAAPRTASYPAGVRFDYTGATSAGPVLTITNYGGELKSIKIGVVLSKIMAISGPNAKRNGFQSTLTYSYSGIYQPVASASYNFATLLDNNPLSGFNNLQEKLPIAKYKIYGLSSFVMNDGSACTSMSIDVAINTPNSFTVTLNNKDYFKDIVIQGDIYFPPTRSTCTPGVQFTSMIFDVSIAIANDGPSPSLVDARAGNVKNLRYIKTRLSEKFETVPSDITQQSISQLTDNPLNLVFNLNGKFNDNALVRLNSEVVMNGLTDGKPYGIRVIMKPTKTVVPAAAFATPPNNLKYEFSLMVNGNSLYKKSFTGLQLDGILAAVAANTNAALSQQHYGINLKGTTAKFEYSLIIPRPPTDNTLYSFNIEVDLFEFTEVYDPVTQCCVSKCPNSSGLDVTVTPSVCVACDFSKGLSFNPSTSSCKCADGFYLNPALQFQCFPCQAKLCAVCDAVNTGVCRTCMIGASLNPIDNTCSCQTGFYESNGACVACPARCAACKSGLVCDSCSDTKRDLTNNCACVASFFDAGIDKCQSCNPGCATCTSSASCLTCDAKKFRVVKGGACICDDGFFELAFQNGTRQCRPCSPECKTCSQSSAECTSCDASINRVDGYDSLGHKTCICRPGYNSKTGAACVQSNCQADKFCTQCEKDLKLCIRCDSSLLRVIKLPENICVCANGFYEDATSNTCRPCADGCAKCSSPTKCQACVAGSVDDKTGTCTCNKGTFFTIATNRVRYCQNCIKYCDRCTDALTCQTCQPGFSLSADKTCICPLKNFINPAGQCVPCKAGCEICQTAATCSKCVAPLVLQQNTCLAQCSAGYFLQGTTCIGCPQNCVGCTATNQCFYCKDRFFLHQGKCYSSCPSGTVAELSTLKCIPCNSPCRTCTNHPSTCTSCEPGEGFLQITASEQRCVKECSDGTYPKNNVCQVCDFRCAKCLGASNNCIACPATRSLFNGACWGSCPGVVLNGTCVNQCPAGFYKLNDQQCRKCNVDCLTCDSDSSCTTCANNLLSKQGRCVANCGEGFYAFRGICVACDRSCKSCAQNPIRCTVCADEFVLSGAGRCVSTCSEGFFLDNASRSCRLCSSSCKTCSSERNCLSCPNALILPVVGQCRSCNYPCDTCSADLSVCNSCLSGFYLSNGQCLGSCPSGQRPVNDICTCGSGVFLDGACVTSCPSGFTRVGAECRRCQSPCTQCLGSASFCTDCPDTFTLKPYTGSCSSTSNCNYGQEEISGKCERICSQNSYYLNNACIFGGCPTGFKDNGFGGCVSAEVNTNRCEIPTFRLNTACTADCGNGFYPNFNTKTCDACSTNCQNCLDRSFCLTCATGFQVIDGRCVAQSRCPATQFSNNGACVATCPIGTSTSNGRCVRSCPPGTFYFGFVCYKTCPLEAENFTDNACVATCPTGTTLIDKVCATIV